jgi:hypothetical protein
MAEPKYKPVDEHRWISLAQFARELGRTPHQTLKALNKAGYVGMKTKRGRYTRTVVYDASKVEVIKGLYNVPHRTVMDDVDDWLSRHVASGQQPTKEIEHGI